MSAQSQCKHGGACCSDHGPKVAVVAEEPAVPAEESTPEYISTLSPWQLAQRGLLTYLQEFIEKRDFDVNATDDDGITCMHWAAINNRVDCIKYFLERGGKVDPIGGELKGTPLQWAVRQGHLDVATVLIKHGADPQFRDIQGFNCLHLASQFGWLALTAYCVAKGVDIDARDAEGRTALMWAAAKSFSADLLRLLVGLGASLNLQDSNSGSTALHFAVAASNNVAIRVLITAGCNKDIANANGLTPREMLWSEPAPPGRLTARQRALQNLLPKTEGGPLSTFRRDPLRRRVLLVTPFVGIIAVGYSFELMKSSWWMGLLALFASLYLWVDVASKLSKTYYQPAAAPNQLALYYGTLTVFYVTYFTQFWPLMSPLENMAVLAGFLPLHWAFYKTNTTDPGTVPTNPSERNKTIVALAERNMLSSDVFCPTCVIRKPLRSKHCSICHRCVAKFDHHCPFVDTDVGAGNHRYFMHYLMAFVFSNIMFLIGCMRYFSMECPTHTSFFYRMWLGASCSPFTAWLFFQGCIHTLWVSLLMLAHIKQIGFDDMTTNESVNRWRYHYLKGKSPWHKGLVGNFVEFYFPTIDWRNVYDVPDRSASKA